MIPVPIIAKNSSDVAKAGFPEVKQASAVSIILHVF